jgi:DtxR family Mn-dependent transcriptional regulator
MYEWLKPGGTMRPSMFSESIENYLKIIYEGTVNRQAISTSEIAECLKVAPASVTVMLQRLATTEPALVCYQKHHGVYLTAEGETQALQIIRRHRLIEQYLVTFLGYTWDEVHNEAEFLEHAASQKLIDRMDLFLGSPAFDPHGDPIPDARLKISRRRTFPLSEGTPGEWFILRRVRTQDSELLGYLAGLGMIPGSELLIHDVIAFDQTMHLQLKDQSHVHVIGNEITRCLEVERLTP